MGDAVQDMASAISFMRTKHGERCGAFIVGYSFGGAAIWQFLASCNSDKPHASMMWTKVEHGRKHWLRGCVVLSGALRCQGEDTVNLFSSFQYLERIQVPLLIFHGSDDDNVSFSTALKAYRKAPSYKT